MTNVLWTFLLAMIWAVLSVTSLDDDGDWKVYLICHVIMIATTFLMNERGKDD